MATTWALDFVLTLRENGRDVRPELVRRLADAISNALDGLTPDTLGQARTAAWALAQLTREGIARSGAHRGAPKPHGRPRT